jgi:hypothetical protein
VTIRLSIDRFERDKKQIAVLLTEDGTAINFPKALLPKGVKAGDILTLQIERDAEATRELTDKTRMVQDQLKAGPFGDSAAQHRPGWDHRGRERRATVAGRGPADRGEGAARGERPADERRRCSADRAPCQRQHRHGGKAGGPAWGRAGDREVDHRREALTVGGGAGAGPGNRTETAGRDPLSGHREVINWIGPAKAHGWI